MEIRDSALKVEAAGFSDAGYQPDYMLSQSINTAVREPQISQWLFHFAVAKCANLTEYLCVPLLYTMVHSLWYEHFSFPL
jgi:hypothetical protein